jgi:chemotaxis protein MotB
MKRKRTLPPSDKGAPKWMVTYSDLMSLVLVFFILLFSMSQIDIIKFKAIAESFRQRQVLDFYPSVIPSENPSAQPQITTNDGNETNDSLLSSENEQDLLEQLLVEVQQYLEDNGLSDVAVATRTERGVVLVLQEKVLFRTGEADIIPSAYPFLNKVGTLLKKIPNVVKVEGHTDNRPISTAKYPSNWELSTARASSVIRFLIKQNHLDPKRFMAVGYGDTRPIAPNDGPENWQKNRRVEIIISDPSYNENEP